MTDHRRPGRPPLDDHDPSVSVTVRMPGKQFDAIDARAREARLSLAAYIRQLLAQTRHTQRRVTGSNSTS